MSIQEVSAERLAELLHHYHEALAPDFGTSAEPPHQAWKDVPSRERKRMVAAARMALVEIAAAAQERENKERYFAKPGEAEWGC